MYTSIVTEFQAKQRAKNPAFADPAPEDLTFSDLRYPCAVTSYDLIGKRTVLFNTLQHHKVRLLDALLATSAAPSYFPIHNFKGIVPRNKYDMSDVNLADTPENASNFIGEPFSGLICLNMLELPFACVDGGVWANDPRLIALLFQRIKLESVDGPPTLLYVLSFGTGKAKPPNPPVDYSDAMGRSRVAWLPGVPGLSEPHISVSM